MLSPGQSPSQRQIVARADVILLTLTRPRPSYCFKMESKLDVLTIVIAVCVAAYAALGIGYVARLGLSVQEIRSAAVLIAGVIATLVGIDFFGKKLRKAKSK